MAQPVNLNRFRKQKARAERKSRANENAVTYGRSKAEKTVAQARTEKAIRDHDGKKRET